MNLALIPQNREKADIVALAADFLPFLNRCQLMATGTTGGRLTSKLGLDVECLLSGPMGDDLLIGARLAMRLVDAVIFLRDPMTPQPRKADINALMRGCAVRSIPCATNGAGARLLLAGWDAKHGD